MQFDACVFIGRFQPYHNGHERVLRRALEVAETVVVCIGSAKGARRPRNPWSWQERASMIGDNPRIIATPIRDYTYREDRWLEGVQSAVGGVLGPRYKNPKVALIGMHKDESGYYLQRFPQWDSVPVDPVDALHATTIREALLHTGAIADVPASTAKFLEIYMGTAEADRMRREMSFINEYRKNHDAGAYHRNNVTADAVVVQGGHILMVRRKGHPGKGMLALPGGHVGRKEIPSDAAIRELREETRIKVPAPALKGSIVAERWFDDPYRSDLARTYTKAVFMRLKGEGNKLARVRGGDDAESAIWVPLNELREDECFDDHWHIVDAFVGLE